MAFEEGERKIKYYDIQVFLPDGTDQSPDPPIGSGQLNLSSADLNRFLTERMSSLDEGDPDLTANALWAAAKEEFPDHKVSRVRMRDWVATKMPPSKRFRRGQKPGN